jgi:internalin A
MQPWFATWHRTLAAVLAVAVLAGGGGHAGSSQPGGKDSSLPETMVAAWKKADAHPVWVRVGEFGWLEFIRGQESKPGDLPAFSIVWKIGVLSKLPAPQAPFGLVLGLVTDAGLKELAGLKQLQTLALRASQVTDAGLKELAALKQLQTLDLGGTKITDARLKELAGLKQLQTLNLDFTEVTGTGLKELAALKQLQALNLSLTQVTDTGLKELAGLKQLQTLNLHETKITDAGLKELKRALPECEILLFSDMD